MQQGWNNYAVLPNESLQKKLDYYITPYNAGMIYKRHMEFDSDENSSIIHNPKNSN